MVSHIERILKRIDWSLMRWMYGSAHSSIIGLISAEWIKQTKENSVLDVAPSPVTGKGRSGQKNADLLLCKKNRPFIVVEVETSVDTYTDKIESLLKYLRNTRDYKGIQAGLLVMTNMCSGKTKYKHNWDLAKAKVKNKKFTIAFVSLEKTRAALSESTMDLLRGRNDYYPWGVENIDYWIHTARGRVVEGNLWRNR